ncbi:UDP-N-acetylmuramate--alanine ligase [Bathymodiolus thermophilus thioautotrophic gill symbiont]|uniref:UDP-N-acetylmuramate--L-alanine ligase n=1 Tax=Bathymodiolus thermophilus thioautotrophic gill symbiont TaxID=2360 RepID=A0A3G3IKF2_9GAMM|nr:UDP-N-acetylmuramate--L-alanine ligase [Bathymodiolus thermophilus thioautotrophic gill symbiont]AYQ56315.1 UDP-N-acetylmuramate--L-alanine ligase [Bathymodiolus thermophilus thioautotrophic gill symbiont]CAB5506398.1 UDP-N-acetylmuramate--L-alanine ligase (EC [Bathymodiolus thermophilus thioautotrophic gill symbiont]SGZ68398.1 UDP-N-acetylmuramate--alanine ligase [Bathymodiolus thermophilus thioautotrophic gill symbiont]
MNNLRHISNFRIKHIHFIGIGGSGMSGIAEVLHNLGYQISGSDLNQSSVTERLQKLGCEIFTTHHQDNVKNADVVVVSSAINGKNPELIKAHDTNIPVVPRAEMLAEIMRFRFGIAVAGTHGKTTTTSLIAHILHTAKLDPTYIIGGILNSNGINAKLGESDYLIAEADESDASFLLLQPMLSVITNIDQDHMSTYDNDYKKLTDAFVSFTSNLPFYGVCVLCGDDAGVKKILNSIHRPLVTFGFSNGVDVQANNISQTDRKMCFEVIHTPKKQSFKIELNLIGKHNILNTLAAIGVACELDININIIQQALKSFKGVERRLDYHGTLTIGNQSVILFDDYGHHPNEIMAVFESLRNTYQNKRLVVIFQPHRYTRTRDLFDDFSHALSTVDALILLDIYPANEQPIANINSSTLANSIRQRCTLDPIVVKSTDEALKILPNIVKNGDVVLTLGAGDIHTLIGLLINAKS